MFEKEQKRFDRFRNKSTPQFDCDPLAYAYDLLDSCHEIMRNLDLVEPNGVNFTTFPLKG